MKASNYPRDQITREFLSLSSTNNDKSPPARVFKAPKARLQDNPCPPSVDPNNPSSSEATGPPASSSGGLPPSGSQDSDSADQIGNHTSQRIETQNTRNQPRPQTATSPPRTEGSGQGPTGLLSPRAEKTSNVEPLRSKNVREHRKDADDRYSNNDSDEGNQRIDISIPAHQASDNQLIVGAPPILSLLGLDYSDSQ